MSHAELGVEKRFLTLPVGIPCFRGIFFGVSLVNLNVQTFSKTAAESTKRVIIIITKCSTLLLSNLLLSNMSGHKM